MERTGRHPRSPEAEHFVTTRMVVKIGTSTITGGKRQPDMDFMRDIARQSAVLISSGIGVAIVSSGAVALGKDEQTNGESILEKQASALYGQPRLIANWLSAFEANGIEHVGQALYTDADFESHPNNIKEVLLKGLRRGPVIINYNDAVADIEMRKVDRSVDNDALAGKVAQLIDADLLILTDVDGVMDGGERIAYVQNLQDIADLLHKGGTGTGGAQSKCDEAKKAADLGKISVIANGRAKDVILKVARGESVGTRFYADPKWMFPSG